MTSSMILFLVITVIYISLLLVNKIPPITISILLPFIFIMLGISTRESIFSVYSSNLLWILASGIVVAKSIEVSNLFKNVTNYLFKLSNSSLYLFAYFLGLIGIALVFVVPSTTCRGIILLGLCLAIAKEADISPLSKTSSCLFICGFFACMSPRLIVLTGDLCNLIGVSFLDKIWNYKISYVQFLSDNFLTSILYIAINISLCLLIIRPENKLNIGHSFLKLRKSDYILAVVLVLILILNLTSSVHKLSFDVILVIAACILSIPKLGIISTQEFAKISFSPVFTVAGVLSIGIAARDCKIVEFLVPYVSSMGHDYIVFKLIGLSTLCLNLIYGIPTVYMLMPLFLPMAVDPREAIAFMYSMIYSMDQILSPTACGICLYFYLSNYIKLEHFVKVFTCKIVLSFAIVPIYYWYWMKV